MSTLRCQYHKMTEILSRMTDLYYWRSEYHQLSPKAYDKPLLSRSRGQKMLSRIEHLYYWTQEYSSSPGIAEGRRYCPGLLISTTGGQNIISSSAVESRRYCPDLLISTTGGQKIISSPIVELRRCCPDLLISISRGQNIISSPLVKGRRYCPDLLISNIRGQKIISFPAQGGQKMLSRWRLWISDVIRVIHVSTDKVGLWYYWNGLASINPKTSMGGIHYIRVVIDSQTQNYWKKFQMKILQFSYWETLI